MRRAARITLIASVLTISAAAGWISGSARAPAAAMAGAATEFLAGLDDKHKSEALFAFDSRERMEWSFVPGRHHGLAFTDMSDTNRAAARGLVRTALSSRGMLKVESIIALENILRELEHSTMRDPLRYSVAIFGTPGDAAAWGWHFEGHHISLNFTCVNDRVVSTTPYFLGANPAEVRGGVQAGTRVLAAEEDLARELITALPAAQRALAIIAAEAPAEVLSIPGRPIDGMWPEPPLGIAARDLAPDHRQMLDELIDEYLRNLRGALADAETERIRAAGPLLIRFCWAGSIEKGRPHYYRITGPTFVIEYDNTQNDANHVHTIWHDRTSDFGADALAEHLGADHK